MILLYHHCFLSPSSIMFNHDHVKSCDLTSRCSTRQWCSLLMRQPGDAMRCICKILQTQHRLRKNTTTNTQAPPRDSQHKKHPQGKLLQSVRCPPSRSSRLPGEAWTHAPWCGWAGPARTVADSSPMPAAQPAWVSHQGTPHDRFRGGRCHPGFPDHLSPKMRELREVLDSLSACHIFLNQNENTDYERS